MPAARVGSAELDRRLRSVELLATALEDRVRAVDRTIGLLDAEHNAGEERRRDEAARAELEDLRRDRREAAEALAAAQRSL